MIRNCENNQFLLHSQQPFFVENKNLESLRDEIDRIDSKIVDLLNQRVRAAVEIGRIKNELGVDPYDPAREEQVFEKLGNINSGPLHKDSSYYLSRDHIGINCLGKKFDDWLFRTRSNLYPSGCGYHRIHIKLPSLTRYS